MRILRSLTLGTLGSIMLLAPALHADQRLGKNVSPTKVAVVDDEPMSHEAVRAQPPDEIRTEALSTRGTDDAQPMAINRPTPTPTATGVQTSLPDAVTHQVKAPPPSAGVGPATLSDDTVMEMAAHQMRHQRRSLDACATAAQRRHPSVRGSVTLHLRVEDRKVVNVSVDSDSLHDAALASCLVSAGRALNFSLQHASFFWPVSLSSPSINAPTASR